MSTSLLGKICLLPYKGGTFYVRSLQATSRCAIRGLGKGPAQAAEGTEPMFVGGSRDVFLRQQRLLEAIGDPISYLGEVEQASAFKLISNLIGMTNVAVLAEGVALG